MGSKTALSVSYFYCTKNSTHTPPSAHSLLKKCWNCPLSIFISPYFLFDRWRSMSNSISTVYYTVFQECHLQTYMILLTLFCMLTYLCESSAGNTLIPAARNLWKQTSHSRLNCDWNCIHDETSGIVFLMKWLVQSIIYVCILIFYYIPFNNWGETS